MTAASTAPRMATRKTISRAGDLAINGAPPAFETPLVVGRPNILDRELFFKLMDGALERRWLSNGGPLVEELERRVEERLGVRHCVAVCNATVGLEMAVRALDLSGEVIVPSYTFIATAHVLEWLGITPVFVEVDERTHSLSPEAVEAAITPNTTGILAVHLWGHPAAVAELGEVAARHGLKLLYDAAHAFDCAVGGRRIGGFGACEVFSFHATKFFNAMEGGAITTDNDDLAARLRAMRNFGFAGLDNVVTRGTNGKMTEASAAMGLSNLPGLSSVIDVNRRNHRSYERVFGRVPGLRMLAVDDNMTISNYQYAVLEVGPGYAPGRDRLLEALQAENVMARRYFWPGIHRMPFYAENPKFSGLSLPATDAVSSRVIVLPTGPQVDGEDIETIGAVAAALAG
jgi:dTDP-4-amino-4,6-dideoxygalactose transaminase